MCISLPQCGNVICFCDGKWKINISSFNSAFNIFFSDELKIFGKGKYKCRGKSLGPFWFWGSDIVYFSWNGKRTKWIFHFISFLVKMVVTNPIRVALCMYHPYSKLYAAATFWFGSFSSVSRISRLSAIVIEIPENPKKNQNVCAKQENYSQNEVSDLFQTIARA